MHLFFSVGEPSGDQHAARLIEELQRSHPGLTVSGLGGPLMQRAGCQLHYRLTDLAVMGILRVLPLLRRFHAAYRAAEEAFQQQRPDAVVLVDFPGFNWWIARLAKAHGIRVFYYLPPQLWAWAGWRIRRVHRYVDHVLCAFPFEEQWYCQRGAQAEYVGHPFFDEIAERSLDLAFVQQHQPAGGRVIGLLPGSRRQEVEHNWPFMVSTIRAVAKRFPEVRFLVANYNDQQRAWCESALRQASCRAGWPQVAFVVGKTPEVIEAADCCLMVSGSVSLEMLARRKPAVVIYYLDWVLTLVVRLMVRCRFASLPNLIADREILPEFFPRHSNRKEMARATAKLIAWLGDGAELERVAGDLDQVYRRTVRPGAIANASRVILQRMGHAPRRHAA